MSPCLRTAGLLSVLLASAAFARAATPKEIDAAIKKGVETIKARYGKGPAVPVSPGGADIGAGGDPGIGPVCLSGLALLEAGVAGNDPALKNIAEAVRRTAYTETRTYQVSLCLMFLDRLGDPADEPLIQALGVRLIIGQTVNGGWSYSSVGAISPADVQMLKAAKPGQAGKLHPDVERHAQNLAAARNQPGVAEGGVDDNSNTQFAVLAVWLARKHAVPVEDSLKRIEQRFLNTQNPRTGGWAYNFAAGGGEAPGSPAMYCAGLIGLATAVARREERLAKTEQKKDDPKADPKKAPDDPFFNPPKGAESKKNPPKRPPDHIDRAVQFAFQGLGQHVAESARAGHGALTIQTRGLGQHDFYFLWSLERVGVIFGMDKIGGVDWYEAGAHALVHTQGPDGTWPGAGSYGPEVSTAFAVLFLSKSNLARDLSSKVQKEVVTELRAGQAPGTEPKAGQTRPGDPTAGPPDPLAPNPALPGVAVSEAGTLAGQLLRADDKNWATVLKTLRDSKGAVYTQALVAAMGRLDGTRLREAREALAERLTRMTADSLRAMAKAEEAELRRAAVLAMAMKDDKGHVPDVVTSLLDDEELVVRAAKASLKSLTGQDFGPVANASAAEKRLTAQAWKDWMAKQKK